MENRDVSEELDDWQQVDEEGNSSAVKDDFFTRSSVFPPGNHEDLPITNQGDERQQLQPQEPIYLPPTPAAGGDGVRRWMRLHVGALQTGFFHILGRLRNCATCRAGLWSFACMAGGVAAVLLLSFWRRRVLMWWRRRLQLDSSKKSLMAVIDEKDKKINQLLLQIAQMNEILLARRRVPVIRVK
ncbi:uncharacterized protein LOC121793843 [Salvia splendens]|uniref:uncharacterized protein LOC121793843 n=1 Tax=Salvia splendens TaxID=180675 RepID=UPI001C27CB34|nr:uncharacterized protein LOC121793843 [Salvia splendens]